MKHTFTNFKHSKPKLFKTALLALLFTFNFSLVTVTAQYTLTDADVVVTNGTIESCSYSFTVKDIIIPETLDGQTVTGIADKEYSDGVFKEKGIVNIQLPATLEHIGDYAFRTNYLTSVTIPNSVTSIGDYAFYMNSLTSVIIPNSVISIGDWAFSYNSLTSVTIPNSVTSIGDFAFFSNSLTSVTIPNSVTTIGDYAFYGNSLTSVTFEQNSYIRVIGGYAFYNNSGLTGITLPANVNYGFTGYKDKEGNSYVAGDNITNFSTAYYAVLPVHTLTLDDVEFADSEITEYFGGYVDIIIPSSFYVNGADVSVTYIGDNAFRSNSLTSVTIPNSVTSIGTYAFSNNSLTSVTIPNSVTSIGNGAFYSNSLTSVTIPNSVTSIGDFAFFSNSLTSVTIPNSVTSIGVWAFYGNSLTSITLPNPVIKEGYTFTEWQNGSGTVVTVITDFEDSYEAQFSISTAVNNRKASTIKVYPNPVRNMLTIEVAGAYNSLQVITLTGTVVQTVNCTGLSKVQVNMSNITPGVYILKLSGAEGVIVKKVLKE